MVAPLKMKKPICIHDIFLTCIADSFFEPVRRTTKYKLKP